jgi:hypothetical protein
VEQKASLSARGQKGEMRFPLFSGILNPPDSGRSLARTSMLVSSLEVRLLAQATDNFRRWMTEYSLGHLWRLR